MKTKLKALPLIFIYLLLIMTSCKSQKHISAFSIINNEGLEIIRVEDDGSVLASQIKVGILNSKGVLKNMESDTIAYLGNDLLLYDNEGRPMIRIDKQGSMDMGTPEKIRWSEDGKLVISDSKYIQITPNKKEFYGNASLLFFIYSNIQVQNSEIIIEGSTADLDKPINTLPMKIKTQDAKNSMDFKINRITKGHINFGSNKGALSNEIKPDVYNYSNFDASKTENEETIQEFKRLMKGFLDNTMVNERITLRAYLTLKAQNNQSELDKIHNNLAPRPKGGSIHHLPILLFTENDNPVQFIIDQHFVELKGTGMSLINQFLEDNGQQYSEIVTDDFFDTNYPASLREEKESRPTRNWQMGDNE